ncbi:MAG: hypothetical protein CME17_04095 [Gemmatimonadetes bacterium]|nr:hypothetical protein [Gemmatimonadota bacterium]
MSITINELDDKCLHPLYHKYASQSSPQRAYICLDTEARMLSADWYGELGGCYMRTWDGLDIEFDINPELTCHEINKLMRDIVPACAELLAEAKIDEDLVYDIQRACEVITESGGVWDAADFFDGGPAPSSREEALDAASDYEGGATLINLDDYLEQVAKDAQPDKKEWCFNCQAETTWTTSHDVRDDHYRCMGCGTC